jgi:Protein of unknown function (DUF1616)
MRYLDHNVSRSQAEILVTAVAAVAACAAAVLNAPVAVMAVLGITLFAAPGYLLCRLLFGSHIVGLERMAVAAGLVFCVPILGGLLLDAAGVPLQRGSWLGLIAGMTLVCDVVLLTRRRANAVASPAQQGDRRRLPFRHVLAFGLAAIIAVCGVTLARVGVALQHYPGYTQLSLVRPDKNAPTIDLSVGNHEGKTVRYRVVLERNNHRAAIWNLSLTNGQTWHRSSTFPNRYTISVNLFRLPEVSKPYRYVALYGHGIQLP